MTPYLAIDIETTGLNPNTCQVLEIGAVLNDFSKPLLECETFEYTIHHDNIKGEPQALAMNHRLLEAIANGRGVRAEYAMRGLANWLQDRGIPKFHLLGKNVGSFDLQFLEKLPGWPDWLTHYRCLEVGTLFATVEGIAGQEKLGPMVAERLKIPGSPHEALYDARVSLALARQVWGYRE